MIALASGIRNEETVVLLKCVRVALQHDQAEDEVLVLRRVRVVPQLVGCPQ